MKNISPVPLIGLTEIRSASVVKGERKQRVCAFMIHTVDGRVQVVNLAYPSQSIALEWTGGGARGPDPQSTQSTTS